MKIVDIQKNLLISHLGLVGINEELLDTFPVQKLIDKSDEYVCVSFNLHFNKVDSASLLKVLKVVSDSLEIEAKSVERKSSNPDVFMAQVFYDSKKMHWSDSASLKFEELLLELSPFDVKLSANVSINN